MAINRSDQTSGNETVNDADAERTSALINKLLPILNDHPMNIVQAALVSIIIAGARYCFEQGKVEMAFDHLESASSCLDAVIDAWEDEIDSEGESIQ